MLHAMHIVHGLRGRNVTGCQRTIKERTHKHNKHTRYTLAGYMRDFIGY